MLHSRRVGGGGVTSFHWLFYFFSIRSRGRVGIGFSVLCEQLFFLRFFRRFSLDLFFLFSSQRMKELTQRILTADEASQGTMCYRSFFNYIGSISLNAAMHPAAEANIYQVGILCCCTWGIWDSRVLIRRRVSRFIKTTIVSVRIMCGTNVGTRFLGAIKQDKAKTWFMYNMELLSWISKQK